MKEYTHMNFEERVKIDQLLRSKTSISEIAKQLGRHKSTLSRELNKNKTASGEYVAEVADMKVKERRPQRSHLLDKNAPLANFVKEKLTHNYWTPEQIAGFLKVEKSDLGYVSHETIYQWIYGTTQRKEKLWKFLTRSKSKRGKRGCQNKGSSRILHRVSVHERPDITGQLGHWEADLMSFQKNTQFILVVRERESMLTLSCVLENKTAAHVLDKLKDLTFDIPKEFLKTITFDNGTEFAEHYALGVNTYFCDPYSPWQKGGVENTNGRLRRDLPRWINVKNMDEEDFDEIIENYNTTPRKTLGFHTPLKVFQRNLQNVALRT